MLSDLLTYVVAHKSEILATFVIPFAVFTVAKLPDPRMFRGERYFVPYYIFFTIATYYSSGDWTEWGGKLTLPFQQYPKLKDVPTPVPLTFDVPKFFKYDDEKTQHLK